MKKVVFTFGRMNPPTTGHQLLVNKLVAYARQIGAAPRVYLSHSVGPKDPLQYDKKIAFARAAFGSLVKKSNARHVIDILKSLEKEGYTHVTMFAGSDRVPEFTKLLTKYNGDLYNFEYIEVKSAGERDPDADDVSGMSASKMRALAKDEKIAEFIRGAPNTLKAAQAKNMYMAVRKALLGEDVMEYGQNERFLEFIFEGDTKEDDLSDFPSDGEIAKQFDDLDADDLDLDDADAMMLDIILDDEESEKEEVEEARVLGIQQRQKLSQRMKAMSKRLARLREIKRKQMPAQKRLKMRARKAALMLLRRRATGKKNLDYNSLSRSQRIAVDTALVQRFGNKLNSLVGRLATRLMPRVRKQAQEYVKKAKEMKEQVVDPKKKTQIPDQAKDSPLNLDALKINILDTDPQKNDRVAPDPKTAHLHKNRAATHFKTVDEGRKAAGDMHVRDAGDTNIVYQMRKIINSRGDHETVFADGKKANISVADAKKMIAHFDALRMPADKHDFTVQAGKSLSSFRDILSHGYKKPADKKISLGGKSFKEFYLGVGRSRTVSAYDNDEPPGTRRIAEVAKDEDRPEDPNRSRPLSQKMDVLMRLGLVDSDELQKYRRALRSSKKFALQSPELRMKLADLLDKLIDLTTKDPATYSRVRYNVVTKEAMALLNKAEKSGVDVDIIFEVFSRGYNTNEDINEAFARVNSFIAGGKAADMDNDLSEKVNLPHKYRAGLSDKTAAARKSHWDKMSKYSDRDPRAYEPAPGDATAKTKPSKHTLKYKRMYGEEVMDESSDSGLAAKAKKSGVSLSTLRKVYRRGVAAWNSGHRPGTTPQQWGMARVNSYITKGKGTYHGADKDLREEDIDEACWDTHKQVGMKKKGDRMVPNCVPKEEQVDEVLDTTTARMDYLQKAGKQMYGKGSADAKSQTFKKRLAGAKLFNKMTDRKPKVPLHKEAVSDAARAKLGDVAKKHGGKVGFSSTTYKNGKKVTTHGHYNEKGERVVTHTTNEGWISLGATKPGGKPRSFVTDKSKYVKKKGVELRDPDPKPSPADKKARFNESFSEQLSTHEPIPLHKRAKRVKSFHAWEPKAIKYNDESIQRTADVKMVKTKLPDGRIVYRRERAVTNVQQEMYTGSEPVSGNRADPANRFVGTNAIRQNYASVTPGQGSAAGEIAVAKFAPEKVDYTSSMKKKTHTEVDQSKDNAGKKHLSDIRKALGGIRESNDLNESFSAGFELAPFARDYGMRVQSSFEHHPSVQEELDAQEDGVNEAIYQGRQVPLNKPMKGDVKKSKVYVRDPSTGNIKKVNFGDKNLSIKKDQPARKRSYCARSSGQGNLTKKTSANYWSRRAWNC